MELREAINCQGREGKRCWQNKKKSPSVFIALWFLQKWLRY